MKLSAFSKAGEMWPYHLNTHEKQGQMKTILTTTMICTLLSCQSVSQDTSQQLDTVAAIENIPDSLACEQSAGFIWSRVKQTCIQPWDEGITLHILNTSPSFRTSAYVVVDSVQKEAEIFVAEDNSSIVLKQLGTDKYSNGNFNLTKEDHCWTLSLNDTKLYQESKM